MAPPELARDAPVANVLHPIEERLVPVVGHELDAAFIHRGHGLFSQRLRFDKPLRGDERFHDGAAAIAFAERERVRLHFFEQPLLFQIGHDALARFKTIEPGVRAGVGRHVRIFANHFDLRQIVALARLQIVGIVRGSDLHHAGAELRVGDFIEDDRDRAIHQRQRDRLTGEILIARIGRIHGHRGIAEHGFGTRGGHDQIARAAIHRIADVPQVALRVVVLHFQIGKSGGAARAPVDHVSAAIDQAAFVQAHEGFQHGARKVGVQRESLAAPIAAIADALHLRSDAVAVFLLPLPNAADKLFAAQLLARDPFGGQAALHQHLRGDAGVIGARKEQRVVAAHAMPARGGVDHGVIQHVADVQRSSNVGRRNGERKSRSRRVRIGVKNAGLHPPFGPMRLEALRLVCFFQFHGRTSSLASRAKFDSAKTGCCNEWEVTCLPCSSVAQW